MLAVEFGSYAGEASTSLRLRRMVSPTSPALAGGSPCVVVWFGVWFVLLFVSLVLQVQGIPISHFSRVLDDRQCFTARSARHKKKTMLLICRNQMRAGSNAPYSAPIMDPFFFLPCRARHDSSDGRSNSHTIRIQLN